MPAIAPATTVRGDESYSNFSPQLAVGYRLQPDVMAYASVSEGFKAGGWNPASPTGNEAYGEEHAWHLESGVKGGFAGGRVAASAAVFYIDWADLQLNVPNPFVPGQFYIANVGEARSGGVEFELTARPHPRWSSSAMPATPTPASATAASPAASTSPTTSSRTRRSTRPPSAPTSSTRSRTP